MVKTRICMAVAGLFMASSAAIAASGDFVKVDANADGKITLEEGMKVHKDWTEDAFSRLDSDGDGSLNESEYSAAVASSNQSTSSGDEMSTAKSASDAVKTTLQRKSGPASYIKKSADGEMLASNLIGMRIYAVEGDIDEGKLYPADERKEWNDIGEVNDVILDWDGGVKAVVLGVGGFLGLGEKDVAVEMASLRRVREKDDSDDWFLVVNSSKEQLEKAPSYQRNAQ